MITLTKDQNDGVNELLRFEQSPDSMFILRGSAGTGKTSSINEYVKRSTKQVQLSCPTHKAKNVLASKNIGTDVSTIQSLLGLTLEYDKGEQKLKQTAKPRTGNFLTVNVVDEGYMLNREIIQLILADIRKNKTKYIFSGDHCQLPPVGETKSSLDNYCDRFFNLSKIIRQAAGNPIIQACTACRDIIETGVIRDFEFSSNELGSIQLIDKTQYIKKAKELYLSSEYDLNPDFVKTIAFSNEACHKYNHFVNKLNKIPDGESFAIGTKIVFNEGYSKNNKIIIPNNFEGKIVGVKKSVRDGIYYDVIEIEFDDPSSLISSQRIFEVVANNSRVTYSRILDEYRRNAVATKQWHKYYNFKELYADIRVNHAITTTKSQGSTFNNVFIDIADIMKWCDKDVIWNHIYTAISRASQNVYIIS